MDSFIRHDEADRDKKLHTETLNLPGIGEVHRAGPSMATRSDAATTPGATYVGKAPVGSSTSAPVWQIKRIETPTDVVIVTFADGDNNFDNVWDNRAALTYA